MGAYYFDEDIHQTTNIRRRVLANGAEVTPHNKLDQNERDMSLYGIVDFHFNQRVKVSAGLRYIDNKKTADSVFGIAATPESQFPPEQFIDNAIVTQLTSESPGVCPGDGPPCLLPFNNLMLRSREWVYELKSRYQINKDIYTYASFTTGFKSGGFDTRALAAFFGNAQAPVAPESMESFEIGLKSWWHSRALRFNFATFYYQWQDLQTFDVVDGLPGFVNIPEVDIYGFEFELDWQISPNSLVNTNLGFLDTEIKEVGNLTTLDKGHALQNSPPLSANIGFTHSIPSDIGQFDLSIEASYIDKQYDSLAFEEDLFTEKPSQLYINANVNIALTEQLNLSVWAQNLTEQKVCHQIDSLDNVFQARVNDLAGILMCNPSDGVRQFGVTLKNLGS